MYEDPLPTLKVMPMGDTCIENYSLCRDLPDFLCQCPITGKKIMVPPIKKLMPPENYMVLSSKINAPPHRINVSPRPHGSWPPKIVAATLNNALPPNLNIPIEFPGQTTGDGTKYTLRAHLARAQTCNKGVCKSFSNHYVSKY